MAEEQSLCSLCSLCLCGELDLCTASERGGRVGACGAAVPCGPNAPSPFPDLPHDLQMMSRVNDDHAESLGRRETAEKRVHHGRFVRRAEALPAYRGQQ